MKKRNRYSDQELKEFKEIILTKLLIARLNEEDLKTDTGNGIDDTSPTFKVLEEGAATSAKEENSKLLLRQVDLIRSLEEALVRIENKTYGICLDTGNLIPEKRLKLLPNTTLSIEAKRQKEN